LALNMFSIEYSRPKGKQNQFNWKKKVNKNNQIFLYLLIYLL